MPEQGPNEAQDFQAIIKNLVDAWCERRALIPLSILLPVWLGFSGLTDSWHDLRNALRHTRAMAREIMTEAEKERLGRAIAIMDKALWRDDGAEPV